MTSVDAQLDAIVARVGALQIGGSSSSSAHPDGTNLEEFLHKYGKHLEVEEYRTVCNEIRREQQLRRGKASTVRRRIRFMELELEK